MNNIGFFTPEKSITLPSPAHYSSLRPSTPKKGPYLFVGRLSEEKGIRELTSLFQKNGKQLLVVGSGPLEKNLRDKHVMDSNIRFIPHVSQNRIKDYMKSARALIIPSLWYEVLPLVVLEATALGKTVFLSGNKNLKSIRHRGNIIYFKPGDFNDLDQKIKTFERLSQSPKLQHMPNIYSPAAHYDKLCLLYEEIAR